ncbi:MAG: phosphodiester glycosidase family protein [Phormidesmis sp.]
MKLLNKLLSYRLLSHKLLKGSWQLYGLCGFCGLLLILGIGMGRMSIARQGRTVSAPVSASASTESVPMEASYSLQPEYRTYELDQATVHVVSIPAGVAVSIAVADDLMTVKAFATAENAIAVLNGGFFDPYNGETTSHLIFQGNTLSGPADNERLVNNPDVQPYLSQILNRSEFRTYRCRTSAQTSELRYEIAAHDEAASAIADSCTLVDAIGAGPQLLPEDTSFKEGFTDYADDELVRDAIGSTNPNARSAIGIVSDTNEVVLIMAAQRSDASGFTLANMADFAQTLGVDSLLNLDGGSSSTLYYDDQIYPARLDADGNPVERPVKSVIMIK